MPQIRLYEPIVVVSAPITSADTGTTKQVIDVPAGTLVESVEVIVRTAFAGGTPSIDVGDGDDADGWVDTTDITETTKGAYRGDGGDAAYWLGKYYESADTIDAVISSGLTAGNAIVVARMIRLDEIP